ncbi:MAG: cytochrome c family protein [Elusimicrobiota bacterium]
MRTIACAVAVSLLGAFFALDLAAQKDGPAYIGVKKCKMCHMKQFKTWESSKHANNFAALQGDEKKNPECLKCHTTGFGQGGYELAKSDEENSAFINTQCEACHGPGGDHFKAPKDQKKATIQKEVKNCSNCHNPHKNFGEEAKAKRGG